LPVLTARLQLAKSSTDFPGHWFKEPPDVAKPDLGTKRLCGSCGAKFYDLNKSPIVCPKCETVFVPVVVAPRTRPDAPKAPVAAEAVVPETADAEFVSLDEAEAEQQGKKPAAAGAEAGADDEGEDDTIFIEEQEEEGTADVSDIVGEGVEKEEEQ
jgi:uncharacterized protein (TIGR02300 family)